MTAELTDGSDGELGDVATGPKQGFVSTRKMLGDAGEHFALSQFTFNGRPASKMPDNWKGYDLAVETGNGLARVSVKTRSETRGWKISRWFNFDDRQACDWLVMIFRFQSGQIRSWVIPYEVALANANRPGDGRKDPWFRDIGWGKLQNEPLSKYEDNWRLDQ